MGQTVDYEPGQLLIRFYPELSQRDASEVLESIHAEYVKNVGGCGWQLVSVDTSTDICQVAVELIDSTRVWKAEPVIYGSYASQFTDTLFYRQWALENTGQAYPLYNNVGVAGSDIKFAAAVDIDAHADSVLYGWIDTGIALDSTGEIFNDDLSYTDHIIKGRNFDSDDSLDVHDRLGHGTETVSIPAAASNNTFGMTGMVPESRFLVIRGYSSGTSTEAVESFAYAIDNGVDIINYSSGFIGTPVASLEDEVARADTADVLICTVMGNGNAQQPKTWFPGGYASVGTNSGYEDGYRNVFAVGASTNRDSIGDLSARMWVTPDSLPFNSDTCFVTVVAPGLYILVARWADEFTISSGTSFAAPHVAGLAGKIKAKYGDISPDSVRTIIENTSDKIWQDPNKRAYDPDWADSIWHPWYGQGRINAWQALTWDELWGEYSSNQTWSGEKVVASDLVIDSGVTVTIEPGTRLRIRPIDHFDASGQADSNLAEIIVKGTLIADAQGDSTIVFEPYSSVTGDTVCWYGIRVVGNGNIVFRNVEVNNAYLGVDLASTGADTVYDCTFVNNRNFGIYARDDSAASATTMVRRNTITKDSTTTLVGYGIRTDFSPTIDSNTIEFYGYGIYGYTDSPQIKANTLHCCTYGIHVRNTEDAKVWYNRFTGSFSYAIDYYHATVSTRYNQICTDTTNSQDSCLIGLAFGAWGSGEVWFNKFFNCYDYGASVSGSFPDFGENAQVDKGQNWFRIPAWSGSDTAFALYSLNTIEAEKNFWQLGDSTLSDSAAIDFWIRGSGTVDVTPFLTSPPEDEGGQGSKLTTLRTVLPTTYELRQNYPNPFNPATNIAFTLPKPASVRLEVLNILGQRVALVVDQFLPAGTHMATWDGKDSSGRECSSGVYLYRITAADFSETKKMLMLK